jgi:hypothetical protein
VKPFVKPKLNAPRDETAPLIHALGPNIPPLRYYSHRFHTLFVEPAQGRVQKIFSKSFALSLLRHANQANLSRFERRLMT